MADDDFIDLHDIETPFERRIADIIDADTTPLELVAALDERNLTIRKPDTELRSPSPFAALVRFFLFHEISGLPVDGIVDRLEENPEEAAAIGFKDIPNRYDAGGVPDQSRLSRAWNGGRFNAEQCEWVERRADQILRVVHEQGNPMGLRSLEPEDKRDASESTERRHQTEKRNEAAMGAAEMAAAVYEFDRGKNASYDMETFLRVLAEMSAEDKTARTACLLDDDPPNART